MQKKKKYNKKPRTRIDGRTVFKKAFEGNPFDLESQFRQYLGKMNLQQVEPDSRPYKEIKRAFLGGMGSCIILFTEVVADLPEEDGVQAIERLRNDLIEYWNQQLKEI